MLSLLSKHLLGPRSSWKLSRLFSVCHVCPVSNSIYTGQDREARTKFLDKHNKSRRDRYQSDPDYRKTQMLRTKEKYNNLRYVVYSRIGSWLRKHPDVCQELPWKTYPPVLYTEKTEHFCSGCASTRFNGRKLWWTSLTVRESWLCHACYTITDHVMPTGYEDIQTWKDLIKRKEQLG